MRWWVDQLSSLKVVSFDLGLIPI
jgi:hypothetical protein